MKRAILILALSLAITACQPAAFPPPDPLPDQPTTPGPADLPPTDEPCFFMWDRERLPEVSEQVAGVLAAAGVQDVEVRATAFGESCNYESGKPGEFLTMQTDIHLTIPVTDLADDEEAGQRLEPALRAVIAIPKEDLPGPNRGEIEVAFAKDDEQRYLRFSYNRAEQTLAAGKQGADLIFELSQP